MAGLVTGRILFPSGPILSSAAKWAPRTGAAVAAALRLAHSALPLARAPPPGRRTHLHLHFRLPLCYSPRRHHLLPTPLKPLSPSSHVNATDAAAPPILSDVLVYYAASAFTTGVGHMPEQDLCTVAADLRRRAPSNLLVFGLGHKTLLWRSLNHNGRTMDLDENEYHIALFEEEHPAGPLLEDYDVAYTTRVSDLDELFDSARARLGDEWEAL